MSHTLSHRLRPFPLALLLGTLLVASWACGPSEEGDGAESPADPASDSASTADESEADVLGVVPHFELVEPSGLAFAYPALRGKVWLASVAPASLENDRATVEAVAALRADLVAAGVPADELRAVSFTGDPDGDTPERLTAWSESSGVDPLSHFLLGGDATDLRRVAERLGSADDGSADGSVLVIDRLGRIRGSYEVSDADERAAALARAEAVVAETRPLAYPEDIMNPQWLEPRREEQLAAAEGYSVRHDFSFEDRLAESGITFVNRSTDDSGKYYRTNHYDHGNGVSVADVDGDGHLDLYFVTQLGGNELWRSRGDGTFENITASAGVALADRVGVTAAFGDIDNDDDPDLFVTTVRGGNVLLRNDGNGRFEDISEAAGVAATGHASGAVFFDYDRDGALDLFVTHVGRYTTDELGEGGYYKGYPIAFDGHLKPERAERSHLYRNRGDGTFEDATESTGLVELGWNGDAAVVDIDRDGWLDLYVTDMQGHDELWRNVEGTRFENRSREVFPETPFGTMGIQVFDFDNDGLLDIYLTDMHTDMVRKFGVEEEKAKLPSDEMPPRENLGSDPAEHVRGNAFYRNLGNGRFEETSDSIGAENYWPWGLSSGDLNADGHIDVFVASSMSYGWRYAVNSLLLNEDGERFRDAEFVLGVEPRARHLNGVPWYDLDCDGADAEHFLCADRQGEWEVWGALGSRSSVIFDLDGDGDLDIVTNEFNAAPMVLVSNLADRHPISYLQVDLRGTTSPRDAIGARVVVRAGEQSWTQVQDGSSGYLSFSLMPLYFGLGDARQVDSIEVVWPSGQVQTLDGPIESNQTLEIVENQG